jgi:lactate permease
VVVGLLASGRVSALTAGLMGLLSTFLVAAATTATPGARLWHDVLVGGWLAWLVVSIIATGLFFYRCIQTRSPAERGEVMAATPRRLWAVCFLLAPFAESVTGFGVGFIIALAALKRLGVVGLPALLFGLFSQTLVPWGALAVGTTVGAGLAGIPLSDMGVRSALLQGPIHALYLVLYWRIARSAGFPVGPAQKLDDLAWTLALIAGVCLTNAYAEVEIAGAAPTALLMALRYWRDERPNRQQLLEALRDQAPYVMLTLALCATRLIAPLSQALKPIGRLAPFDGQPAFSPFYAPGFWLAAMGGLVLLQTRASLPRVLADTAQGAWRACLVTLAFVVMAQLYVGTGMARQIAEALHLSVGRWSVAGVPLFAAVAGFLTGSGAASNAMLMPMLSALARALQLDSAWLAAIQNTVCANLSMLSPMRVSMGAAVLGFAGSEGMLYRKAWPLALPALIVGMVAVALMLLGG